LNADWPREESVSLIEIADRTWTTQRFEDQQLRITAAHLKGYLSKGTGTYRFRTISESGNRIQAECARGSNWCTQFQAFLGAQFLSACCQLSECWRSTSLEQAWSALSSSRTSLWQDKYPGAANNE
jgi:hypothetical protein